MKTVMTLQYAGKDIHDKDIVAAAKEAWVAEGNKIKEIQTLNIYMKPEEHMIYYVINDTFSGKQPM